MDFYSQPLSDLFKTFNSSHKGLSSSVAIKNKENYGQNKLNSQKKVSLTSRFFKQFKNLMIIVLLFSALLSTIISLATKQYSELFEGAMIFVIVIL